MKIKNLILILLIGSFIHAMDNEPISNQPPTYQSAVQVFMLPADSQALQNTMNTLIDNAKRQIHVAVYFLTNQAIINRLTVAKKRGVSVWIMIDEKPYDSATIPANLGIFMQTLIDHNIVPRIYPSRRAQRLGLGGLGIMHNKFMVIDDKVVTGSANFTDATMRLRNIRLNYENVLLLHKPAIAWKYRKQFYEIQKAIFNMYIGLIRNNESDRLPIWLRRLAPVLYDRDRSFRAFVNTRLPRFTQEQQDRLMNLLKPPRQRVIRNRVTRGQDRYNPIGSRPEQNR